MLGCRSLIIDFFFSGFDIKILAYDFIIFIRLYFPMLCFSHVYKSEVFKIFHDLQFID